MYFFACYQPKIYTSKCLLFKIFFSYYQPKIVHVNVFFLVINPENVPVIVFSYVIVPRNDFLFVISLEILPVSVCLRACVCVCVCVCVGLCRFEWSRYCKCPSKCMFIVEKNCTSTFLFICCFSLFLF